MLFVSYVWIVSLKADIDLYFIAFGITFWLGSMLKYNLQLNRT